MNIQQGTDQHNRIISFGTLECQQPQLLVLDIITFKFGEQCGGGPPQHPKPKATCSPTPEHQYKAGSRVTTATPASSLPHSSWFYCPRIKGRRQDSFLGGSQSQMLHIWQSTANKNLIPSPSLWNQKAFFPNLLFVVCSSLKGKPGKCTFCREKKKKIKPYLIEIEPGEGRSKMQGNNRKYSCF